EPLEHNSCDGNGRSSLSADTSLRRDEPRWKPVHDQWPYYVFRLDGRRTTGADGGECKCFRSCRRYGRTRSLGSPSVDAKPGRSRSLGSDKSVWLLQRRQCPCGSDLPCVGPA